MKKMFILMKLSDSDNFIIGKLVNETDGEIIIEYPISIRLTPNAMGTTSVSTTKMMPFSMNNKVAIMKVKIVAMSKPNEKIIGYYTNFVEKYGKIYDELLEDDILGLKAKEGELPDDDELDDEIEDNVVTFKLPTSNNSVH
jgi:hypothetical protein